MSQLMCGFRDWICGRVADSVLSLIMGNDKLGKAIDSAVKVWAGGLKENEHVEPISLFNYYDGLVDDAMHPHYFKLQQTLKSRNLPKKREIFDALMENWLHVKENISEPQPFYNLEINIAKEKLEQLAELIYEACKQNEEMFRNFMIAGMDELLSIQKMKVSPYCDIIQYHSCPK